MNFDRVLEFLRALDREGVENVLVGGVAASANDVPRTARDVNLVVRINERSVERIKNALKRVWADPSIERIAYRDPATDPLIVYAPPTEAIVVRLIWERAWEMAGRFIPPRGVFKFRSIEEANAHRRAWEDERLALIKQRPKSDKSDHPK